MQRINEPQTLPPAQLLGEGIFARHSLNPNSSQEEKVLWIHGYTLDSSIWSTLWENLSNWQHVGIDLPEHGASACLEKGETLSTLSNRIGKLAIAHHISHLIGLSFGGMIALQVATQFPDAFSTLTLAAPGLGGGASDPAAQSRNIEMIALYRNRGRGAWLTEKWMQSPPDIFKGASRYPRLWQALEQIVSRHAWQELTDHRMNALTNYPQSESSMSRIKATTLLLVGEEDMPSFKRNAEIIRRAIPNAHRKYISGAGHLCLLEKPMSVIPLLDRHLCTFSRTLQL